MRELLLCGLLLCILSGGSAAQSPPSSVREYKRAFPTYPFSDPNPIPTFGRIYPYFRFDGFAHRAEPREWTVVELENQYLRVMILPEIGGKIWNAVDKRTGRSFIYFNQVVKFRDVAMRGPWTSGGIEANYGIIGHTPNVATPVDYVASTNADGSATCVIGALDLLTGTPWRLEIRLRPDEAMFSTSSFWYNASAVDQPYYTWMNVGIKVSGKLQYIFPGTSYLGHGGEHGPWPIDSLGRDISWYDNNAFGGYKSYHVFGQATDFFGAYWHDDDFGMVRYAPRDEKLGKKIWIWGLSRQGMIWEQLLTDHDGQYSEVQSGRLFNQTAEQSTRTPFKHRGFAPHTSERWTEYWYPVAGTGGLVAASRVGALNVTVEGQTAILRLSPTVRIADTLRVSVGTRTLAQAFVNRPPLQLYVDTIALSAGDRDSLRIDLGDHRLEYDANRLAGALARPVDAPADFDWQSAYGLAVQGREWLRQREYARAEASLDSALARDPNLVPALVDRAMLAVRAGDHAHARGLTTRALSSDTYDPNANYYYGLANRRSGRLADAKDGFEVAALAPETRGAAWTELARLVLAEGKLSAADDYADKALSVDAGNLDAIAVKIVVARRRGDRSRHAAVLAALSQVDPLSHRAQLEHLLMAGDPEAGSKVLHGIRAELPEQVMFDLAAWYLDAGEPDIARTLLVAVGDQPVALYWRAALADSGEAQALIARANTLAPRLVFPFRVELEGVLRHAAAATDDWRPRYYLALTLAGLGRGAAAESLFVGLGDYPDFAPFYAARAMWPDRSANEIRRDLERAAMLDTAEWRYGKLLVERALDASDSTAALAVGRRYAHRFPNNAVVGVWYVRALEANGRYREADSILARIEVLPAEGASDVHSLFRTAKLMLAIEAMAAKRWQRASDLVAAARTWPEHLGEGKPYAADVDERVEDWLDASIAELRGRRREALKLWEGLASRTNLTGDASDVTRGWALAKLGRVEDARVILQAWPLERLRHGISGRILAAWAARFP